MYGASCNELGYTYKLIGTVLTITKQYKDALNYLFKAQAICELNNNIKLLTEVADKLDYL